MVSTIVSAIQLPETVDLEVLIKQLTIAEPDSQLFSTDQAIHKIVTEYLQDQRAWLDQQYTRPQIISDSDDVGKLITIAESFRCIKSFDVTHLRLGRRRIPEHIVIKTPHQSFVMGFLQVAASSFTARIRNFNELVAIHREVRFGLFRDRRTPAITSSLAKEEVEKLRNAPNGNFVILEKEDRVALELIYKLITDIQNQDLEVELEVALRVLTAQPKPHWLIKIFLFENSP